MIIANFQGRIVSLPFQGYLLPCSVGYIQHLTSMYGRIIYTTHNYESPI